MPTATAIEITISPRRFCLMVTMYGRRMPPHGNERRSLQGLDRASSLLSWRALVHYVGVTSTDISAMVTPHLHTSPEIQLRDVVEPVAVCHQFCHRRVGNRRAANTSAATRLTFAVRAVVGHTTDDPSGIGSVRRHEDRTVSDAGRARKSPSQGGARRVSQGNPYRTGISSAPA